jgi:3-dehydroquinate synthase
MGKTSMKKDFDINYPLIHQGTEKTEVVFYQNEKELFSNIVDTENKQIYVTDSNIALLPEVKKFLDDQKAKNHPVVILTAGEENKTLDSVLSIVKAALEGDFNRNSVFVGIGGGVITDMTAFAASIFKRGARLELIPTSLLAMVDAACGGKTGCDFENYKNMIGSFYPAKKLHICPEFVQSLPESEYFSGLAEAIKTAMLYDKEMFEDFESKSDLIKERNPEILDKIIEKCVSAKAKIVEEDLTEKGLRMQLNLGHTFAHALETVAGLGAISHGEAVAWGCGRAIDLSVKLGLASKDYKERVFAMLEKYGYSVEKSHPVLVGKIAENQIAETLIKAMKKDKKNSSSTIKVVLQRDIKQTEIIQVADSEIAKVL